MTFSSVPKVPCLKSGSRANLILHVLEPIPVAFWTGPRYSPLVPKRLSGLLAFGKGPGLGNHGQVRNLDSKISSDVWRS